jgi:RNA 2',3'-cyclic 3'-phosphodiesterase
VKNLAYGKSELPTQANPRLFFALWFDSAMSRALFKLAEQQRLKAGGRTMRPETLHMTLLFLGSTPTERLLELNQAVAKVHVPRFDLAIDQFAGWQHNGIGYAAPSRIPEELVLLESELRHHVTEAGFSFDRRGFTPHVTLLRKVQRTIAIVQVPPLKWAVREFVLVQSVPDAEGVSYRILSRWTLT